MIIKNELSIWSCNKRINSGFSVAFMFYLDYFKLPEIFNNFSVFQLN